MKKNKATKAYWYRDNIKKIRIGFLIFNIIILSIVFFACTSVLTIIVEERFFYNVQTEIETLNKKIDSSFNDTLQSIKIEDARVTVAYYYTNPNDTNQLFDPTIIGSSVVGTLDKKYVTGIIDIVDSETNVFEKIEILNHYYMTYTTKEWIKTVDFESSKDIVVCYVKIYMNIDGEIAAKNELNTGLTLCTILLTIMISLSSYLIMRRSVKPIEEFVDKQVTFVSDASHELRTPLAIVQSKIENTLANPNLTVYDVSENLAISLKEIARLNKLTTDLLALARSDQNKLIYHLEKTNLNIVLSEIIEPFIEIAGFEERELTYDGEDGEVMSDKDKFRELMIILLDNALKYTNEKDSIHITLKSGMFDAIIEVADTGIGISDETKNKIFERFYREDKARSRQTGGNGLGLSIAKTIVSDLKGKIIVDHNAPKGTKFIITLPKTK